MYFEIFINKLIDNIVFEGNKNTNMNMINTIVFDEFIQKRIYLWSSLAADIIDMVKKEMP